MILSRVRIIAQERYDLEDLLAQLSSIRTDSKLYTREFLSSENYILKGFKLSGIGLKSASLDVTSGTLINAGGSYDFSYYIVEDGTTAITIPDAELEDGQRNYIELELYTSTSTPVTKAFWDPSANGGAGAEFNQEIDTMEDLNVRVVASTGGFSGSSDRIRVGIIDVDGSGNITGIRDKRDMFFRLGTGADPLNEFTWSSQEEPYLTINMSGVVGTFTLGETVTFSSGATAVVVQGGTTSIRVELPSSDAFLAADTVTGSDSGATGALTTYIEEFSGADKEITDFKEAINAIMTEIKALKGTSQWFNKASGSVEGIYDSLNSQITASSLTAQWTWSGSQLSLSDDNGSPVDGDLLAKLLLIGKNQSIDLSRQDATSVPIDVADGEVLFIKLPESGDRTYSGLGSGDTNYQVVAVADFDRADNNYWLAVRQGTRLYMRGYGEFEPGETAQVGDPITQQTLTYIGAVDETDGDPNYSSVNVLTQGTDLTSGMGELDAAIGVSGTNNNQDRNMKLVSGGTWSVVDNAGVLEVSNSADAYIEIGGISLTRNTIDNQTISLPNANSVAYIDISRVDGPTILQSVSVADIDAVVLDDTKLIFMRRTPEGVLIGNSFLIEAGEFLELDGALAELNRYFGQLRLIPHESNAKQIRVTGADITKLSGSKIRLSLKNLLLSFDGAVIDYSTGEIFESDGVTPLNGGANDFVPPTITANEFLWSSVNLLANTTNAVNEITGQINVIFQTVSNALLTSAPKAAFASGISLGQVFVQEDGAGDVLDLSYTNIIQMSVGGSGGGGDGDAFAFDREMDIKQYDNFYEYYTSIIFGRDEETLLDDGNSTGTFINADGLYELDTAQVLTTSNLFTPEFTARTIKSLIKDLVVDYADDASIDSAAVYEISIDGGVSYDIITMEQFVGTTRFIGRITLTDNATFDDLRVRITSSGDDKKIENIAVFYNEMINGVIAGLKNIQKFSISGDDDVTDFVLNRFLPDPDLVKFRVAETGQTFVFPALSLSGYTVSVPAGTLEIPGESLTIVIDQLQGNSFDNSDENASIIAENGLGSMDDSLDKSSPGVGPILRDEISGLRNGMRLSGGILYIEEKE
tara:strand:+ start:45131 stop:48415 length:3285 start_codon:yes stop_codon:yes gene_type:complete